MANLRPLPMHREGYLILATGHPKYLEMAANLAASIGVMDPGRRVCAVLDAEAECPAALRPFFDDIAVLPPDEAFTGVMNKLRLYEASPYQRTMVVDADCLLVKPDVQRYWDLAAQSYFTITGGPQVAGEWKGADVAALLRQEGAPYLIRMNSGVYCFDRSPEAAAFFEGLTAFYFARRDYLGVGLHRGRPAQTDEIYFGIYMGLCGMDNGTGGRFGADSWMVSTWRGFGMRFDPARGISVIRKPRRSVAGIPHPFGGWDTISPTFAHFIGLKPRRIYRSLSRHFREQSRTARQLA